MKNLGSAENGVRVCLRSWCESAEVKRDGQRLPIGYAVQVADGVPAYGTSAKYIRSNTGRIALRAFNAGWPAVAR
jgi:hypothetical protein